MNLWIVENDSNQLERLIRILSFLDASINVTDTFQDLTSLFERVEVTKAPRLILINQDVVPSDSKLLENKAKIILPINNKPVVYLAVCIEENDNEFQLINAFPSLTLDANPGAAAMSLAKQHDTLVQSRPVKSRFLVMNGQKFQSVPVENIAYFYSDDRFVFFMTYEKQKFLVEYKLEELEQLLDPKTFFRINRSFIVSINSLEAIHPYFGSRLKLKLVPPTKKEIIVSRHRASSFKAWLGE